jgi:hypothetical protein
VIIGSVPLVKKAIKMGADPAACSYWAICRAAFDYNVELIELLLPYCDANWVFSELLTIISRKNNQGSLELKRKIVNAQRVKSEIKNILRR